MLKLNILWSFQTVPAYQNLNLNPVAKNILEKVMFSSKIKDVKVKEIKNECFLTRRSPMSIIFFPEEGDLPVGFSDLGTGQSVADESAGHRRGVQAVADGRQHVRVPHPVDVQRGTELGVTLRGRGD